MLCAPTTETWLSMATAAPVASALVVPLLVATPSERSQVKLPVLHW